MFKGKDKATFVDAHPEDIEWNYPSKEIEYLYKRNEELEKDYTNISNDYQRLLNRSEELDEELKLTIEGNDNYHNRIDKAIEYIVINREPVDERDGEVSFWLSDEFDEEDLLKILKGEENDKN